MRFQRDDIIEFGSKTYTVLGYAGHGGYARYGELVVVAGIMTYFIPAHFPVVMLTSKHRVMLTENVQY